MPEETPTPAESRAEEPKEPKKKPFSPPRLANLGTVEAFTEGTQRS